MMTRKKEGWVGGEGFIGSQVREKCPNEWEYDVILSLTQEGVLQSSRSKSEVEGDLDILSEKATT